MNALLDRRRMILPLVVAIMIVGAMVTYTAKADAIATAERVADLRHEVAQERIKISLLKAEIAELSQPSRLQSLIERYPVIFDLGPFEIGRMVRIGDLPFPSEEDVDLIADALIGAL